MRVLLIALLAAISYAQTVSKPLENIPDTTVSWRSVENGEVEITIDSSLTGNRWFAFGVSAAGNMINGDAFVAFTDTQTITRMRLEKNGQTPIPVADADQLHHTLVSFEQTDRTRITWRVPKQHYCDPMLDIIDQDQWYAYAYGNGPSFGYHLGRGAITANLGAQNPRIIPDLSQDSTLTKWTVTMPNHEVGTASNSYYCIYKAVPGTEGYRRGQVEDYEYPPVSYIMGHKPVITTNKVHHIVVNVCHRSVSFDFDNDPSRQEGVAFECANMPQGCEQVIPHVWAPGSMDYWKYPDFNGEAVGYPMGGREFSHIVIQMHYNNPNGESGVIDASGFDFYYTTDSVPHSPVMNFFGPNLDSLQIPPCQDWFELETFFPAPCQEYFTSTKYILGSFPHMHQQGKIGSATLIRDGHEVTQLVNTSYHFDFQTFYLYGEPIEFRSTDTIRFSCIYESPTTGTWTYGGDFSEEEMCFFGLLFLRDNEVLDYDCAQISNARFKKEGYSLPSHMTNLLEQNGVDLFSGQDDKLFAMVPDTVEDTSWIPAGWEQKRSDMSWKNYQPNPRDGSTCAWAQDYKKGMVGDEIVWPNDDSACPNDDHQGYYLYYKGLVESYDGDNSEWLEWIDNYISWMGCEIIANEDDAMEKFNTCHYHRPETATYCPCNCADAVNPCEVGDDEGIIETAASVGIDISGCDDPTVAALCEHPDYGETVSNLCPNICGSEECLFQCRDMCRSHKYLQSDALWAYDPTQPEDFDTFDCTKACGACHSICDTMDAALSEKETQVWYCNGGVHGWRHSLEGNLATECVSGGGVWEKMTCGAVATFLAAGNSFECNNGYQYSIVTECQCHDDRRRNLMAGIPAEFPSLKMNSRRRRRLSGDDNAEEMTCSIRTTTTTTTTDATTTTTTDDACSDTGCPAVVCGDGSNPPIPDGECCGDLSLCPDLCADTVCPEVVCNDGSEPPIPQGQCCGDISLCPTSSPSTVHKVRTQLTFNGITSSNFESKKPGLKSALSSQTGIAQDKIELTYISRRRSRRMLNTATVEATFEVEDEAMQTSLSNTISHNDFVSNLNTAIASEDSLSSISVTEVSTPERFTESNSTGSDDDDNMVIYIIIAACAVPVVSLLIVFLACPQWLGCGEKKGEKSGIELTDDKRTGGGEPSHSIVDTAE